MTIVFGVQIPNTIYLTSSTKVDEGSNFACARSPNGFDEFDQVGTRDEWQSVVDVLCVCVCVCVYESRSKRASVGHTPANERCRPLLTPLIVCDRQGEMFDE